MKTTFDPVKQMIEDYKVAASTKNVDAFCAIYDADVHVFDMWNRWTMRGLDAWKEMAQNWFLSLGNEQVIVEAKDIESHVADDFAVGHAIFTFTAVSAQGEKLRSLDNRVTVVLKRINDQWKVIHEHTSAPIDHVSLKAMIPPPLM